MPRPSKYSQQTADRILQALKAGNTLRASAAYVGVTEDTLINWRKRYSDFSEQVDIAEAGAEVMYAAVLAKAAQAGDWRERKEVQQSGEVKINVVYADADADPAEAA